MEEKRKEKRKEEKRKEDDAGRTSYNNMLLLRA